MFFYRTGKAADATDFASSTAAWEAVAALAALGHSQALIEFAPDGTILSANQKFLDAMGYGLG